MSEAMVAVRTEIEGAPALKAVDLVKYTGMSAKALTLAVCFDATFPKPVELDSGRFYRQADIDAWLAKAYTCPACKTEKPLGARHNDVDARCLDCVISGGVA